MLLSPVRSCFYWALVGCWLAIGVPFVTAQTVPQQFPTTKGPAVSTVAGATTSVRKITPVQLGQGNRAFRVGNVVLAGQPSATDFAALERKGIRRVLNLYRPARGSIDEPSVCQSLSLEYQHLPFDDPSQLNDTIFNGVRIALLESNRKPVLVHCKSNDRVTAVWAAYRTLDQGVDLETAIREAKAMGMKTVGYERKLRDYVARMLQPVSPAGPAAAPGSS